MPGLGWTATSLSYVGWVPNVESHLSFSLIGAGVGGGVNRFSKPYTDPDRVGRFAWALQKRQTDDFLVPKWYKRWRMPDVVQHWMLAGSSQPTPTPVRIDEATGKIDCLCDEQGMLVGHIYMMPHQPSFYDRCVQTHLLGWLRGTMRRTEPWDDAALDALGPRIHQRVKADSAGSVAMRFALMRSGEVRIWYDEPVEGLSPDHHYYLAKQAYFFVKDMAHDHVHHEPASDQITPLKIFRHENREQALKSEASWRRETLWKLSREMEIQSRNDTLDKFREAMGILAYADAFQKSLLPYLRDLDDPETFVPNKSVYGFNYEHIRESTRIRIDQMAAKRTATGQLLSALAAGAFAAVALLSSLVATRNAALRFDGSSAEPLHISVPEPVLCFLAEFPVVAALISAYFVYHAFAFCLSDVLLHKPSKRTQLLRGLCLSAAQRFKLGARGAHRLIAGAYILLNGTLLVSLVIGLAMMSDPAFREWLNAVMGGPYGN